METWRRIAPFILAGLLLVSIAIAIAEGDRWNWLMVALVALGLAAALVQRARGTRP